MRKVLIFGMMLAVIAAVGLLSGCEEPWDDDDDDAVAGTTTIQGNVADFSVPVAAGVKAGVTVMLKGTGYKAETAEDGSFVISGVPAGEYILVIKYGDTEAEYPIGTVAENSRIEIKDLTVSSGGSVSIASVTVVDLGTDTSSKTVSDDDDDDEEEDEEEGADVTLNIERGT